MSDKTEEPIAEQAARYRWLRDKSEPNICAFYLSVGMGLHGVRFTRETVDAAIDAAMQAESRTDTARLPPAEASKPDEKNSAAGQPLVGLSDEREAKSQDWDSIEGLTRIKDDVTRSNHDRTVAATVLVKKIIAAPAVPQSPPTPTQKGGPHADGISVAEVKPEGRDSVTNAQPTPEVGLPELSAAPKQGDQ